MLNDQRPGTCYWIDHYVVCTNDVDTWEDFHTRVLGARTMPAPPERRQRGVFQDLTRCHHGGFVAKEPLPPTKGLGVGCPRHGFYIYADDIDFHLRRLDEAGAIHSDPIRTSAEGEAGTTIYWQDPDGNQFEFWAPDKLPEGAMTDCGPERIGRISHGVYESRDLDRTAAFFDRYCALDPVRSADIPKDTLVLPLAAGARLVFKQVDELGGRTAGFGLPAPHAALVVQMDDFMSNYERMWAELPEWDYDERDGKPIENPGALPARTALHGSPAGRKWKQIYGRGDDWYDPDTNCFHFYGGIPVGGGSLAVYEGRSMEYLVQKYMESKGETGFRPEMPH